MTRARGESLLSLGKNCGKALCSFVRLRHLFSLSPFHSLFHRVVIELTVRRSLCLEATRILITSSCYKTGDMKTIKFHIFLSLFASPFIIISFFTFFLGDMKIYTCWMQSERERERGRTRKTSYFFYTHGTIKKGVYFFRCTGFTSQQQQKSVKRREEYK